jgi:hypothetical protein
MTVETQGSEGCSMPAPYDGGCLCGLIRYRLADEPITLYVCHCTECQRRTGSAFALSMVAFKSALELLQGDPRTFAVTSGRIQRCGKFCVECSTRLWNEPPRVSIPNDTLNFEQQPDDPMVMVKAWQDRATRERPAGGDQVLTRSCLCRKVRFVIRGGSRPMASRRNSNGGEAKDRWLRCPGRSTPSRR